MTGPNTPQIARDVRRLRADIQTAVHSFPNFHKRVVGEELRRQARKVHDLVVWYWREQDRERRVVWAERLVHAIDLLKEDLQVAKQDEAFPRGFRQFEHLFRQAESIGGQAGGILRSLKHPKGQDARGCNAQAQRAQILSTHAAPAGVNL
jgi:hypothetical protein